MATATESRAALEKLLEAAVTAAGRLVSDLSPAERRAALLASVPGLIDYYGLGSAALAADLYDDERERFNPAGRFLAEPVQNDRGEKIGRAVAWATDVEDVEVLRQRLEGVVQLETARPYRDTITTNRRRDRAAVGWRRINAGGCKFCRMLAERGAVYKEETVRFASHKSCKCTAAPAFDGYDGPEASTLQYVASQRRRSEQDKQRLRDYLASMPD